MSGSPGLATIVLAAGAGSRFGAGAKLVAELDGEPLLARVLAALDGVGEPRVVVLGAHAERVGNVVTGSWRPVRAAGWAAGPGASLRAGLAAAPTAAAALVVLGDLAWLRREAVERVLAAAADDPAEAVRACEGATPGHPLLLRGSLLECARSAPDAGLAALLGRVPVARVECSGLGVARDVDTPLDLGRPLP